MIINDGTGGCHAAKVGPDGKLSVLSKNRSLQHAVSEEDQRAFQILTTTNLASGTVVAMHLKNTNEDKNVTFTYIRHQIVGATGGTAFPNVNNYFRVAADRTYDSGGVEITPVNVNIKSGITSGVTAFNGNPTLAGTAQEIDRWYTKANGDMNSFNKEGALILSPNQTIELSYVGDHSGGLIYTRVSFVVEGME
jgi:hypothetical protein